MSEQGKSKLRTSIDAIEGGYEFMLAYAAQGRDFEYTGGGAGPSIRGYLGGLKDGLGSIADDFEADKYKCRQTMENIDYSPGFCLKDKGVTLPERRIYFQKKQPSCNQGNQTEHHNRMMHQFLFKRIFTTQNFSAIIKKFTNIAH